MNKSDLRNLIKEEISKVLKENEGNSDYEISMTINGDIEKSYTVLSIEPDIAYSKGYFMTVRDNESGKRNKFAINNHKGGMEFWLGEHYKSYPTTEKDMNKILFLFNDAGIDIN